MNRLDELARDIRRCRRCRLGHLRENAVPGEGPEDAKAFFVGEAPGREEDRKGRPFVGQSGKILTSAMESCGLHRDRAFITSVIKCRPPGNQKPRADEVEACRPYLVEQIDTVRPNVIVALGQQAISTLTTWSGGLTEARKEWFVYHGIELVATYHPAAILYRRQWQASLRKDIERAVKVSRTSEPRTGGVKPVAGLPLVRRVSSGGVVWDGGSKFLLIRRMEEGLWCIPKGGIDHGETPEEAALREIREETGLSCRIVLHLKTIGYRFHDISARKNFDKTVHFFLARAPGRRVTLERGFEDFRWCTYKDARRLVHYPKDRSVIDAAMRAVRALP